MTPAPRRALWSRGEPVSILGALRNAHGQAEIDALFAHLGRTFWNCTSYAFELQTYDVVGLRDQRVEIAMMRTPDGHSRLELSRFLTPPTIDDHRNAPVNALGYLRVMFAVEDIDDTLARLLS